MSLVWKIIVYLPTSGIGRIIFILWSSTLEKEQKCLKKKNSNLLIYH